MKLEREETEKNQIYLTEWNSPSLQSGSTPQDIFLSLKGDLPADDDKEENSQTPTLQAPAVVALIPHPFRGWVHFRSLVVRVLIFDKRSRTEVYELDVAGLHVDQDVFVLYVAVKYSSAMTVSNSFDDLKFDKLSNG